MKLFKKILLMTLVAVFGFFAFAACTGNNLGGVSENGIVVMLDNKDKAFLEPLIADFESKNAPYTVSPIWTAGDDIQKDQATKIGTKSRLDVIVGGDMYTEVYKRNLVDLGGRVAADADELALDDIVPGVMDNLKSKDGKTVFLPRYFNLSFLYYNKNLFDAAKSKLDALNLTAPPSGVPEAEKHYPNENWTIEDYFKAGGALTLFEGSTVTQWGSETLTSWWGEWLIHVRQSGGDLFDANGNIAFDNAAGKTAMQIMRDKSYGNQDLNRPKISVAPGQPDLAGFQAQKTAMIYGGHTANWSRYDSISGLNWGITVLPTGKSTRSGAEFAVEGMGINKNAKNPEGAWAFIKYMSGKAAIGKMTDAGYMPIRESVYLDMEDGSKKDRVAYAFEAIDPEGRFADYARTLPKYEYFVEIANTIASSEIGLMMANDSSRISIDTCVKNIQEKGNNFIQLYYK